MKRTSARPFNRTRIIKAKFSLDQSQVDWMRDGGRPEFFYKGDRFIFRECYTPLPLIIEDKLSVEIEFIEAPKKLR